MTFGVRTNDQLLYIRAPGNHAAVVYSPATTKGKLLRSPPIIRNVALSDDALVFQLHMGETVRAQGLRVDRLLFLSADGTVIRKSAVGAMSSAQRRSPQTHPPTTAGSQQPLTAPRGSIRITLLSHCGAWIHTIGQYLI